MTGGCGLSSTTAIVLAGGLGTRLRAVVGDRPKVLALVGGRPFLSYLLDQIAAAGIERTVLCTGYRGDLVRDAFGDRYGAMRLEYSLEDAPAGTAGALRLAAPRVASSEVLVLNGDSYCRVDLLDLWDWHHVRPAHATLVLTSVADGRRFGRVEFGGDGRVLRFSEKSEAPGPCWINGGIYLLHAALLSRIPAGRSVSLESEIFPRWLGRGLYGYPSFGGFIDIGTPESFSAADAFVDGLPRPELEPRASVAPAQSAIALAQEHA
jgi:NDP-sugar pyrophosphorylase family protein